MRKLTILLVVLMLCLQVFSGTVAYGAETDDKIKINSTKQSIKEIREGDSFGLVINCENMSGSVITNINAVIDFSSSFRPLIEGNLKLFDTLVADNNEYESNNMNLKYLGTGDSLNITLNYTIGANTYSQTNTIHIPGVIESDTVTTPTAPTDTSKYMPKLGTTSGNSIPTIVAGNSTKLTFPVKNSSIYQARNINMTLKMTDEAKAPLVLENFDLRQAVEAINGNESKDVSFDIKILRNAPEGLYSLKLNYEFQNGYNDPPFSSSETVYIRVQNENVNPRLTVDSVSVKPEATSADVINLELKVKNLGNLAARDIKVTLGGLKSGGFTTYNSTDIKYINNVAGNSIATVGYQLLMPTSGAAGSNELSVKLDYRDITGNTYSEQNQIFVPVGDGEGTKPNISFEKIVSPQEVLVTNNDFSVSMDLKNNGGAAAKNVKISLTADQGIITKSMNPVFIDKLDANASKNVLFKMFAADEAATKNYPIALNVEYEDAFGVKYNATQYIGVYIENDTGKTVPRIIIDNYSMDPFPVSAGEDFKLKMSFLNTSKLVDVSNIKVTVSSDDGTFTPTDSGNTFFLEGIPSKKNVERELLLHVKPDAEQKSYLLTVNFEYEDEKGNPFTTKETMSVRVLQNPRLVTGQLNLMPETFVGQPISIYLDFYNMGKSILYNLMVKVEGDFQGQSLNYYVGNFEPGRTDFFDTQITPMAPGTQKGSVLFSFEDANGKTTEIRKEFSLNVMEMMQEGPMLDENGMPIDKGMIDGKPGMNGMPGGMPVKSTSILVYIIPAVVVLAIAFVVFIILRKRQVRRKEMSLDE